MKYRVEIDGLRAFAVLPVILYHAGFSGFSGGFVGVDIFFVISGYLITSIIVSDLEQNKFSIINFYERRARRILPALSFMLIMTTLASYILMPAELLKEFSQSLVSVVVFASNIFFFLEIDYFSLASDEMPLLHTWSLAVEEQYYIFFPLMLAWLWFLGKRKVLGVIIGLSVLSLMLSQYWVMNGQADMAFFWIFSRAWELFVGAILVFIPKNTLTTAKLNNVLAVCGLILIVLAVTFFETNTPHPSVYTLVPVIGTLLIIRFANSNNLVGRLLAHKFFVSIGLISYSLYLWHQPIFAFLRMKSVGEPSLAIFCLAIALSIVMAIVSYKYIETPYRNKTLYNRKRIFQLSFLSLSVFMCIGLVGHFGKGFEQRYSLPSYSDTIVYSPKREKCHTKGTDYLKPTQACTYFGDEITWASLGDSHTVEPAYALAEKLQEHDQGLLQLSFSGCLPALSYSAPEAGCTKWLNDSVSYLENNKQIKNVLVGFRYSGGLYGEGVDHFPEIPTRVILQLKGYEEASAEQLLELYWQNLTQLLTRLQNAGKKVYLLYPIPELPVHINKATTAFSIFSREPIIDLERATTREYYLQRNRFILNKLDSLTYDTDLVAIRPLDILCDSEYCPAVYEGKALYFDDDHLSLEGSRIVIEKIISSAYAKAR
ncbi:acyltransferase family protein [Candidatus Colwellia aromaticivorans]|uniref:acyltransferase family protein n=1 Tax=Candidatus Colwellia aromaticivorans TaxID=2267621 RepID=UPI000DF14258|nr:acyltransferase family protein [Candidatus Colwellia aromaticivorans]